MKLVARIRHLWLVDFAADLFAVAAAYFVTLGIRFHSTFGARLFDGVNLTLGVEPTGAMPWFEDFYVESAFRIILLIALAVCPIYALRNLYPGRRFIRPRPVVWDALVANAIALGCFYAYWYMQRNVFHPRSFFLTVLALNVAMSAVFRGLAHGALGWARRRFGVDACPTVLLGAGAEADAIAGVIDLLHPHGMAVAERVTAAAGEPFEGMLARVEDAAQRSGAGMVVAADKRLPVGDIVRLLEAASARALPVKVLSEHLGVVVNQAGLPADMIRGVPLVHFGAGSSEGAAAKARRAAALAFAALLLAALAPVMALIALLVRLTSPGPALFVQERVGVNRVPFRMYKFRTMYHRADELQAEVEEFNESGGTLFKMRRDPRITPVGRFLRRFSLDELPQLLNVLKGEMTLVGPRPLPLRDFANYYETWHYSRHDGLPGLTCLWQVSGRSNVSFRDMCILDLYYLRNQNAVLDLQIIIRTLVAVLFARGAY